MQKSKIDLDKFYELWYNGEDIDIDAIEDPTLKEMYVEYAAQEEDLADLYEKIGRYLDAHSGSGRQIHGDSLEEVDEQPHFSGLRFSD
jgi:hypothetical protein